MHSSCTGTLVVVLKRQQSPVQFLTDDDDNDDQPHAALLYTAEHPYLIYSCITVPLNVSGARTLQSLQQQLPFMKLFSLALRCLPKDGPYCHVPREAAST